jgi:hypothetical protein
MEFSVIFPFFLIGTTFAQTGFPTASFPSDVPSSSGYPTPGNFSACSSTLDAYCSQPDQVTFCYDTNSVLWTVNCAVEFSGQALQSNVSSAAPTGPTRRDTACISDCQAQCDGSSACVAFNTDGGNCTLLSSISGINAPAYGILGAYKGYWPSGAGAPSNSSSSNYTLPAVNETSPSNSSETTTASSDTTTPVTTDPATSQNTTTDVSPTTVSPPRHQCRRIFEY